MKFSVVIPLYNGAKTIEKTLDSVLAQSYKNYEVILVNDDSPDNVSDVVKKYILKHPNTKFVYIEQKNKGLGGARNTAIKDASGEIIAILDQDDIWYPEKLEKVAKIYKEKPKVSVISHALNVRKSGKIIRSLHDGPKAADMYRALLFGGNRLSTPAVCFRKEIIDSIGYFSEDKNNCYLVEDYDLWLRIARAGYKFEFLPDILGEYTLHAENFGASSFKRLYLSEISVMDKNYRLLKKKNVLDWYLLRRHRAKVFYMIAVKYFSQLHDNWMSMIYLLKAFLSDPFFYFYFLSIAIRRGMNVFNRKGDF